MPRFFAMTSRGLADVLERELIAIGAEKTQKAPGGVYFDGSFALCYRANLRLRSASRVVMPTLEFEARSNDELYAEIGKYDFTKIISPRGTLAVEANVRDSEVFRDQRFVAMKIKDAVVDQFREKHGARPDVDAKNADLHIVTRAVGARFSVSIDTSGAALFKRGYRIESVEAPLKENVAAALLMSTEWNQSSPIVDPMCGSGTFLIEAAMLAMRTAPGSLRTSFAFQRFLDFDPAAWDSELDAAVSDELDELPFKLYGFDIDRRAVAAARANVKKAGLEHVIEVERSPLETLELPAAILENPQAKGMMVTNPPYGERIGDKHDLLETYMNLAFLMKSKFKGWDCWVLSGDPELSAAMKLKAERRIPAFNGKIECRFLKYRMF